MNYDLLIKKIINKEISFHRLPEDMSEEEKVEVRRKALEKMTGVNLVNIGKYAFDPEVAGKRNCENLLGGVSVPLGVAGPLLLNGQYAQGKFYIPLATTEGALVASINRGCKAITECGGGEIRVKDVGITRAPVYIFKAKGKRQKAKVQLKNQKLILYKWLKNNFITIKQTCEGTSRHLKLLKIEPYFEEDAVFLRFSFDTGLAMGMNMATIACAAASLYIEKNTDLKLVALSGNACCDKKASRINGEKGRGKQVLAEVMLADKILQEVLKTTAHDFLEVYRLKIELGTKVAGTLGKNAQIANVAAAIFLACGQDIAHITEAAIGETKCTLHENGVEVSVWLPDLPLGVIGGGTGFATQRESLQILGAVGDLGTDSLKFAEIVGGAVLAGEISLLGALANNDLAKAHQGLGRRNKNF